VLETLHSERFIDMAPAEVYATLLDEGSYLDSISTMYRILRAADEVHERRHHAVHPALVKPELVAEQPNSVWSWDITKLHGPTKWTYYYLYVIIDIYSRYVAGWMVASREHSLLAERLLADSICKHGIDANQLTNPRRQRLLDGLQTGGVAASRPRGHQEPLPAPREQRQPLLRGPVQDSQVPPGLPSPVRQPGGRSQLLPAVLCLVQRRARHSGIGFHTPADLHYGRAPQLSERRADVLAEAYAAHPKRFVRKHPEPPRLPGVAWINRPLQEVA
jgi:putative transposase